MSTGNELSASIARWAFASEKVASNDIALNSAKNSIAQEPTNGNANVFMALLYLDEGKVASAKIPSIRCKTHFIELNSKKSITPDECLTNGSNEILFSTLCLFVSVIYGALTDFTDFSVSETLTLTQEALKRAAGSPAIM